MNKLTADGIGMRKTMRATVLGATVAAMAAGGFFTACSKPMVEPPAMMHLDAGRILPDAAQNRAMDEIRRVLARHILGILSNSSNLGLVRSAAGATQAESVRVTVDLAMDQSGTVRITAMNASVGDSTTDISGMKSRIDLSRIVLPRGGECPPSIRITLPPG